jgi:hypothetical protein
MLMCVFKLWLDYKFLLCLKHEIVGCVSKNNNKKDVCVFVFSYMFNISINHHFLIHEN